MRAQLTLKEKFDRYIRALDFRVVGLTGGKATPIEVFVISQNDCRFVVRPHGLRIRPL